MKPYSSSQGIGFFIKLGKAPLPVQVVLLFSIGALIWLDDALGFRSRRSQRPS